MVTVILAHIAGVPVEETLLSFGPALVAAVSVGLVHIRSLRGRPPFDEPDPPPIDEVGREGVTRASRTARESP